MFQIILVTDGRKAKLCSLSSFLRKVLKLILVVRITFRREEKNMEFGLKFASIINFFSRILNWGVAQNY